MGLRDIARAEHDHLFHLLDKSHTVRTVGDRGGFALAGEFERGADQGGVNGRIERPAVMSEIKVKPVHFCAFADAVD